MKTLICLGPKACDVGEKFEKDNTLKIKLIDKEISGENCFSIPRQKTAEEYEKNTPDMSDFFADVSEEVLFLTSGDCDVLSCSLRILQQVRDKKITVLYLKPVQAFLSTKGTLQDKVVSGILQEYARSGVFERFIFLSEDKTENFIIESSVEDFYDQYIKFVRDMITNFLFTDTDHLLGHTVTPSAASRILTFGFYDLNTNSERTLYDLINISDCSYHFFLSDNTLKNNKKLLREIKERLITKKSDTLQVSYAIRKTTAEIDYCFVVYYTKMVQ